MSTDLNSVGLGLRKASPEALALMMQNLKNNNNMVNTKKVWVPNGTKGGVVDPKKGAQK
jgi:hypothetical protein